MAVLQRKAVNISPSGAVTLTWKEIPFYPLDLVTCHSGLKLAECQEPTKASLSLISTAEEERENITKGP